VGKRVRKQIPPGGLSPAQLKAIEQGEDPEVATVDVSALYGALHVVVSVSLTSRELEIVNEFMKRSGLSRSEAIRLLIRRGWAYSRILWDKEAEELRSQSS